MGGIAVSSTTKKAHVWERDPHNWYVEPEEATEALLVVERFAGKIWDPACGQGNIVNTLIDRGYSAFGTDIVQRHDGAEWWAGQFDFLTDQYPLGAPNIVMNPPFFRAKGAEAFIRRALDIATTKVAAFVDLRFLAGAERAKGLYTDHPPDRVWIITPRLSCPPGEYLKSGGEAKGGTADWCWMVWDMSSPYLGTSMSWLTRGS